MAGTVTERVTGNISSVYSIIRQKTSDIQETLESLASGSHEKHKSMTTMSTVSSRSTSEENLSQKSTKTLSSKSVNRYDSTESDSLAGIDLSARDDKEKILADTEIEDKEEQLIYLITNVLFTVLWRGIDNSGGDSWKERGQVIACINLLGLNNELYCSHLTLRLRILELGVQASLIDLSEAGSQSHTHQQNAAHLLRMVYDLVVLDPNEDEVKKCSPKLLDGVLALLGKIYKRNFFTIRFFYQFVYSQFKMKISLALRCFDGISTNYS